MEVCLALVLANPQSDKAPGKGGGASAAQGVKLTFLLQCEQEPNLLRTGEFETTICALHLDHQVESLRR